MISAFPVVGWVIDLFFKASLAVPFWLIWTVFGLGEKYFYFLPPIYHTPTFWECVGLFVAVPILYWIFVPRLVSVSQTNNKPQSEQKD
jgi:hypothetical protein